MLKHQRHNPNTKTANTPPWYRAALGFIADWAEVLLFFVITTSIILLLLYKFVGFKFFFYSNKLNFFSTIQVESITVFSQEKGRVAEVLVEPGDLVTEGQRLIQFDNDINNTATAKTVSLDTQANMVNRVYNIKVKQLELQEDLLLLKLKDERLKINLNTAKDTLARAEQNYLLTSDLFENSAATIDEYNDASENLIKARASSVLLELNVEQLQKQIQYKQDKILAVKNRSISVFNIVNSFKEMENERINQGFLHMNSVISTELLSPISGRIISRFVQPGLYLPPNQKLFTIGMLDKMKIIVPLTGFDMNYPNEIKLEGNFKVSKFPDKIFRIKVVDMRGSEIELEVINENGLLKPGMQGIVTLFKQRA